MPPGISAQRHTLATLAADLGVSRSTVSNAYNHPDQLSAELRARILARADELGFPGPNPLARGLRRRRVGAVGVILSERLSYAFADPGAVALLDGLAQALEADHLSLLLIAGGADQDLDPVRVDQAVVDAWVAHGSHDDQLGLLVAQSRPEPLVVLDHPRLPGVPWVGIDDRNGGRIAMAHLASLGHRRVAVLSLPQMADGWSGPVDDERSRRATFGVTRERLAGVRDALAEAGLPRDTIRVIECSRNEQALAAEAVVGLLNGTDPPSAVLAMSDQLALGALRAAGQVGISVPADLSVTGFDDVPAAAAADPPLTTIHQPLQERGFKAGALVQALLAGEPVPEETEYPVTLVVRASTAPPPG
jgi:DNA-binding LacI/PurR family transcriptional regulator